MEVAYPTIHGVLLTLPAGLCLEDYSWTLRYRVSQKEDTVDTERTAAQPAEPVQTDLTRVDGGSSFGVPLSGRNGANTPVWWIQ